MAKTHYGYKDGQFKQGKCDVTVGTCPYGNHSEDPNKINDLREYVSKSLSENPSYEAVYNLMSRMHGEKNVTSALLIQQGVPAKLAKAWVNEPVSAEYERDYVADGAEVEPEPAVEEPVSIVPVEETGYLITKPMPTDEELAKMFPDSSPLKRRSLWRIREHIYNSQLKRWKEQDEEELRQLRAQGIDDAQAEALYEDPEDEFLRLSEEDITEDEAEPEVTPEPAKPAPPAVTETIPTDDELEDMYPDVPRDIRMRLWKNAMRQAGVPIPKPEDDGVPSEEELEELYPTVPPNARLGRWKRDKRELEDIHRWNKNNTAFTNIAEKLSNPGLAGTLTDEEKALLEEPYKDIDYINRAIFDNYAGKTLTGDSYDETSAIRALADYGAKGSKVETDIIQSHFHDEANPGRAEDRELARQLTNPDYILDNPNARIRDSRQLATSDLSEIVSAGKDIDIEENKRALATHLDNFEGTLRDARTAKEAFNNAPNPSLEKLKEKARRVDANNLKPASLFTAEGHDVFQSDDPADKAQREEAAEHWKRNFKPGSHIMMGNMDAEVYTLQPDGRVTSSTGRNVGYADYKTGDLRGTDGYPLLDHRNGVRLYGSADALIREAVADGEHFDVAHRSADPGFISKYETDPAYAEPVGKMRKYLADRDAALTEKAKRNEEIYHAQRSADPEDMYEKLNKVGLTIPSYEANMHLPNAAEGIRNRMSSYISSEIQAGRLQYNQDTKEFTRSDRPDTAKMEPKLNYDEVFGGKGTLAENVSLMTAVRRTHNIATSHTSQHADGLSPAVGKYNPAASRRKNWGDTPISAAKADTGDILTSGVLNSDDTVSTYVVLDAANRIVAPVINGRTPIQANVDNTFNAQASEDAITNIEQRAKAKDATVYKIQLTEDFKDDQGRTLELW